MFVDRHGNIWTSDYSTDSILEFAPGSNGNVAPSKTITGGNTGLSRPIDVAVDGAGYVYATNLGNNTVDVFSPTASGNATPVQLIGGASTELGCTAGLGLY